MPVAVCDCQANPQVMFDKNNNSYPNIHGATTPREIIDALDEFGAEASMIYMPLSYQPMFAGYDLVTCERVLKAGEIDKSGTSDELYEAEIGRDAYLRSIVLPSDIDMTQGEIKQVTEIVKACFDKEEIDREAFEEMVAGM